MSDVMRALFSGTSMWPRRRGGAGVVATGWVALAAAWSPAVQAGAEWREGPAGQALAARAQLDFRITVLPSLALRPAGDGLDMVVTTPALVMGTDAEGRAWQRVLGPGRHAAEAVEAVATAARPPTGRPVPTQLTLVTP